jgi:alpha-tubulin suppressor-like RCC1 family protein
MSVQSNEGSIALDSKGKVFTWGPVNHDKTLITPKRMNGINKRVVRTSIGRYNYSVIDSTGMIWVWGENK